MSLKMVAKVALYWGKQAYILTHPANILSLISATNESDSVITAWTPNRSKDSARDVLHPSYEYITVHFYHNHTNNHTLLAFSEYYLLHIAERPSQDFQMFLSSVSHFCPQWCDKSGMIPAFRPIVEAALKCNQIQSATIWHELAALTLSLSAQQTASVC